MKQRRKHGLCRPASGAGNRRPGFSLVELLAVIAILALLMALLMPAVQGARESARRVTCANQLRQCGLAALAHVQSHGGFPHSGGAPRTGRNAWGWAWQVLPFLEQLPLFDNPNDQFCQAQAVPTYFCPTRRPPVSIAGGYWAATSLPRGMLDYAGNGGSHEYWNWSPPAVSPGNGIFLQFSQVYPLTPAHISDGLSSTLLFGEKCMNRSYCTTDQQPDDNEGYTVPWEDDNTRWATSNAFTGLRADITGPKYTFSTILPHNRAFGSSHFGVVQFVFCDGAVQSLTLDVSDDTLRRLCNRKDGQVVSP